MKEIESEQKDIKELPSELPKRLPCLYAIRNEKGEYLARSSTRYTDFYYFTSDTNRAITFKELFFLNRMARKLYGFKAIYQSEDWTPEGTHKDYIRVNGRLEKIERYERSVTFKKLYQQTVVLTEVSNVGQ